MSEDFRQAGRPDRDIALADEDYWICVFVTTRAHLARAVAAVGTSAAAVERWLRENRVVSGRGETRGDASVLVTAFGDGRAWRFRVEIQQRQGDAIAHTVAVGGRDFADLDLALAEGNAYARWLAGEGDGAPPASADDPSTQVRRETMPCPDWSRV